MSRIKFIRQIGKNFENKSKIKTKKDRIEKMTPKIFLRLSFPVFIVFTLIMMSSCKTPTEPNASTALTVEETACEYVWLRVKLPVNNFPVLVNVKQNDKTVSTQTVSTKDTFIVVGGLSVGQAYTFQVEFPFEGKTYLTNKVSTVTLTKTSDDITWQTWEFSGNSFCELNDVTMIDKNNIWVVGDIYQNDTYTYDSAGHWTNPYNIAYWNGTEWKLKRVFIETYGKINVTYSKKIDNIWFGGYHFNGSDYSNVNIPWNYFQTELSKMWVSPTNDLYYSDYSGLIAHYEASTDTWSRINTGLNLPILDMLGVVNKNTGAQKVFLALHGRDDLNDKILSLAPNDKLDSIKWGVNRGIVSLWTNNGNILFTAGEGAFTNLAGKWNEVNSIPRYYSESVRGTALNDVFISGDFGLMAHFNGVDWHNYSELNNKVDVWRRVIVNDECVVAIGSIGQKGIIAIGTRIK